MKDHEVIIIGGGLAGLTAALELSRHGISVAVFEKNRYPRHKVCGEYVSNEVVPYLKSLGVALDMAVPIEYLELTTRKGASFSSKLPLGGIGISRYALDHSLCKRGVEQGVTFYFDTVIGITFTRDVFEVRTTDSGPFKARMVIGAYGKRSNLDKTLKRSFINQKSPWLAVKAHYDFPEFPQNKVALHNFQGGYCGLSKTETNAVNMCYLASYRNFSLYRSIDEFNEKVLSENPNLKYFLNKAQPLWKKPLSIAQVSFAKKETIMNHILFCGDTAGLIHPLCGNGMAMAIHSGKLAAEGIFRYLSSADYSRNAMEQDYSQHWKELFGTRLGFGRGLQQILLKEGLSQTLISGLSRFPSLTRKIIQKTHGKPIQV